MKTKKTAKRRRQPRPGCTAIADLIERHGSIAQFARDLPRLSGQEIKWERVYNWRMRNTIPKNMVIHVHRLTGAPFADLLR